MKIKDLEKMNFKQRMLFWLKLNIIISVVVFISYTLSTYSFALGFLYWGYLIIFGAPAGFLQAVFSLSSLASLLIGFCIFPVYSLILLISLSQHNKKNKWGKVILMVTTILYCVGILLGWLTILVWHP